MISFSLATKEDSGTVLQLGDPVASMEYVIVEVSLFNVWYVHCKWGFGVMS